MKRKNPVSATVVWAASPPAISIPCPPCKSPRWASASATSSASSIRPSATAGKSRSRTAAIDVLPSDVQEIGSGLAIAAGTRHDLQLVTLEASLIQFTRGLRSQTLTMASSDRNFTVTIPDSVQGLGESLELGSLLRITGVCLISYDEFRKPQSFRLLIRRVGDITVRTKPPWWTVEHAIWIIAAMLLSVCAAVGWIAVLRRHVATKTNQLREANERLGRMAAEDGLTGTSNRRRFDELLKLGSELASRTQSALSLVMVD